MKEYLATLDDTTFGAASEVTPKFTGHPIRRRNGRARCADRRSSPTPDNYLIDVKFGIIMDVEATRAIRQAEVGAAKTMIERTEERFDIKPERLAADTAYGSAATLDWIVNEKGISPHIPVIDKSKRKDGTLSREDFIWDSKKNVYICPAGKTLTTTGHASTDHTIRYNALLGDCRACPLKPKCCPSMPSRRILRDVNEAARDVARALLDTQGFEQIAARPQARRDAVCSPQAHPQAGSPPAARPAWSPVRVHTRSPRAEILRRLAKLMARPPPQPMACVA